MWVTRFGGTPEMEHNTEIPANPSQWTCRSSPADAVKMAQLGAMTSERPACK